MSGSCGTLHLLPVGLGPADPAITHPAAVLSILSRLDYFIVENAKSARAELRRLGHSAAMQSLDILELPQRLDEASIDSLLAPLQAGRDGALVSDAGCPAVADPGALVVRRAHALGIVVKPHVGPGSLLLAVMASGLHGQCFKFHGYLPAGSEERIRALRELERESAQRTQTQLFIETPYRNMAMFDALLQYCRPDTLLCVARALTTTDEWVGTRSIADWRRGTRPALERMPSVFLLLAR